jgi:REP element-mobilizing transposase RayT
LPPYRDLLREACDKAGVSVWAYCVMPNLVRLMLTPTTADGLARALGKAHRRYSGFVNARLRGGALRGAEPGEGAACRARRGLAVVERAGASGRAQRRSG